MHSNYSFHPEKTLGLIIKTLILLVLIQSQVITQKLDPTFSTDGIVTIQGGSSYDQARAVALQSDGKIVVAGYSHSGTFNDFFIARLNTDGSLDSNFGTNGKVITSVKMMIT